MKLTDAQKLVLERLAAGDTIHTVSGINANAFWSSLKGRNPRLDTVYRLKDLGMVVEISADWRGTHLRISDAGRAYLESAQ